jgi:hypothetical protein
MFSRATSRIPLLKRNRTSRGFLNVNVRHTRFSRLLGALHAARSALPQDIQGKLTAWIRDIDVGKIPSSLLDRYELPPGPTTAGSGFELYVFRAKRALLPDLAITVQKNINNTLDTLESIRGGHALHTELLPGFVPWQVVQMRDIGGGKERLIRASEHVNIMRDITVGQTEKDIGAMRDSLLESPQETRESFRRFVHELDGLEKRGIYLDIGGKNNVVICTTKNDDVPAIRLVDTGLIGHSDAASEADVRLLKESGIKIARVTERGSDGSWSAEKYRAYVARLKEIVRILN